MREIQRTLAPAARLLAALPAALLAACFNPSLPAQYRCSAAHPACPAGQVCSAGKCVERVARDAGEGADAAPDLLAADSLRGDGPLEAGGAVCGDGQRDGDEQCDGLDLGGQACAALGFDSGTLACSARCTFELAGCVHQGCGNGAIDGAEDCDGAQLGGKTCVELQYAGGDLGCKSNCTFELAGCYKCGDGKLDAGEECDGSDFGGKSCATWTFGGGALSCTAGCKISKAGCSTADYVAIAAGTFLMGSPPTEPCRVGSNDSELQHQVTLTRAFELAQSETTQAQFQARMNYNPAHFSSCGGSCPVENLTWAEAKAYCNALSALRELSPCYSCTGSGASTTCSDPWGASIYDCPGYRLPTDAEWEYAYRAGVPAAYHNGYDGPSAATLCQSAQDPVSAIGWYSAISGGTTHPVKQKLPNAWGLHDMAGNVAEWTHDYYKNDFSAAAVVDPINLHGSYTNPRGGAYHTAASVLRAAGRGSGDPSLSWQGTGFRCARSR